MNQEFLYRFIVVTNTLRVPLLFLLRPRLWTVIVLGSMVICISQVQPYVTDVSPLMSQYIPQMFPGYTVIFPISQISLDTHSLSMSHSAVSQLHNVPEYPNQHTHSLSLNQHPSLDLNLSVPSLDQYLSIFPQSNFFFTRYLFCSAMRMTFPGFLKYNISVFPICRGPMTMCDPVWLSPAPDPWHVWPRQKLFVTCAGGCSTCLGCLYVLQYHTVFCLCMEERNLISTPTLVKCWFL